MYQVIASNPNADFSFSKCCNLIECAKLAIRLHNRMGADVKIIRPDGSNILNQSKRAMLP